MTEQDAWLLAGAALSLLFAAVLVAAETAVARVSPATIDEMRRQGSRSAAPLAVLASVGALVALAVRTEVAGTGRVIGATALFALIYTGFGVLVGALVRSELNGSLIVVFQ